MGAKDFKRLPKWLSTLIVVGLIAAIGLLRFGMTVDVSYRVAPIAAVEPIVGRSWDRMVTVDIDGGQRIMRTSDRMIETVPGELACLETRTRLFKKGHRYSLALPFYCRKALAVRYEGAYL